jgi:hypothetical protein
LQELESENANQVRTLYADNENLRDERQQFVARIVELQTDLKDIKSSDVIRQVHDLQELERENANEVKTLYAENETLRDERAQFVARIREWQTSDLKDIKSSHVFRQVQDLQELEREYANEVKILYAENETLQDERAQLVAHIREWQTSDLKDIKSSDVFLQVQDLQELERENSNEVRILYDENQNLRNERAHQFVAHIREWQTSDLKDIKSSHVFRQVQDLEEQVHIRESVNANEVRTL